VHTIRPARQQDLDTLLALRREAEAWLADRGIRQWTRDMSALIKERLHDGRTWLLEDVGGPFATITLSGPDMDFWRAEDEPENAIYVYKLIVARSHSGRGYGDLLLDWASDRAARAGLAWVRLDCDRSNTALHDYYLARGFEHVRTVELPHRQSGALFQRPSVRLPRPIMIEATSR